MNSQKLSRLLAWTGLLIGGNSLAFGQEFQKREVQWTDETPLYGQHAWEKNLLRHHIGGRLFGSADSESWEMAGVLSDQTDSARALISDDPTIPVTVPTGGRNYDFSFGQRFLLRRVSFLSEELEGTVEVFVAATDPVESNGRWVKIASQNLKTERRGQIVKFAAVDARYLRLKIRSENGGRIFGLGAFGIRKAVEFYDPAERGVREDPLESIAAASAGDMDDLVDVDESAQTVSVESLDSSPTNTMGFARVEMVSSSASGELSHARRILDEDSTSQHEFSLDDPLPTVVLDLGRSCDFGRVSVLYTAGQAGAMTMLIADAQQDGVVSTNGETFPIGNQRLQVRLKRTYDDFEGSGRISFNEFRRAGRYLILQWQSAIAESPNPAEGFSLNEVAVFEHTEDEFVADGARTVAGELRKLIVPRPEGQQISGRRGSTSGGASPGIQSGAAAPANPVSPSEPAEVTVIEVPVSR